MESLFAPERVGEEQRELPISKRSETSDFALSLLFVQVIF